MNCLCSLSKKWIYQKTMSINQQSNHIATILTNTRSIIKESMLIATDFLWVGLSSPKTFNLHSMLPTLSFCAKPKAKSQNPSSKQKSLPFGRGKAAADGGWGPGKSPFLYPSSALTGSFSQGEGYFSLRETLDSAIPGKPFVQNDIRESWKIVTRIQFNKMCS